MLGQKVQLPSLPFDNLYKFASFLLVAIGISALVSTVAVINSHNAKLKENVSQMVKIVNESKVTDSDKAYVELLRNLNSGSLTDTNIICSILFIIGIGSFLAAAWCIKLWYYKEQRKRDEMIDYELKLKKFEYNQKIRKLIEDVGGEEKAREMGMEV